MRGNIGSRAGQVMKEGSTLCCAGNANFMAGYMMYGGRLIICGDSGEQVGQDIHGGTIYVGGAHRRRSAPTPRRSTCEAGEEDDVARLPRALRDPVRRALPKIVNAGKNLHYPRTEPRVRVIPFFVGSQRTDYWNAKVQEDIAVKAQIGRYRIRGYGAGRPLPHLTDLAFKRDLRPSSPTPTSSRRSSSRTSLGGRFGADADRPLDARDDRADELRRAVEVDEDRAGQGLRALRHLRQLGRGRADPGGARGRQARRRAVPRRAPRAGTSTSCAQADGVEIYISQGAKPGLGGQLMAKKVTAGHRAAARHPGGHRPALALAAPGRARRRRPRDQGRGVPRGDGLAEAGLGQARRRPRARRHQDRLQGRLRLRLPGRRPGLDRRRGQRGARVRRHPDPVRRSWRASTRSPRSGPRGMPVVLMGGVKDGIDTAKAIALGAHAVAVGTSAIIAGGCIACLQCARRAVRRRHRDPGPRAREALRHRRREPATSTATSSRCAGSSPRSCRRTATRSVYDLSRDDLVALTPEAAEITRLPVRAGVRRAARDARGRASDVATDAVHQRRPSPTSTGVERVATPPVPPELAPRDDVDDTHFVPAPCQVACPIGTDAPSLHRLHLGGQARGGVRGDHRHEPVLVRLRPRLRRALRARLPPRRLRRPARDPQPQALRDGPARRHATACRRCR